jgi:hypothetical protein
MDKSFSGDGRDLCRVRGAPIYSSSVLLRVERGRKDSDFIEVQPDAPGSDPVQFQCSVQATCVGQLNLGRIPVARPYLPFAEWLTKVLNTATPSHSKDVQKKLAVLIQKGAGDRGLLQDGVLLLEGSTLAHPQELLSRPVTSDILVEFCAVGPGQVCTNPAAPVVWKPSSAPALALKPGFYKVVIDQLAEGREPTAPPEYLRTNDQAYVLLTADAHQYPRLHADFEAARKEAYATLSEDSYANLIAYLDTMATAK